VTSSTTTSTRKRRLSASTSEPKSRLQRSSSPCGNVSGARAPQRSFAAAPALHRQPFLSAKSEQPFVIDLNTIAEHRPETSTNCCPGIGSRARRRAARRPSG
jgi:hypothetical protein